jgi:alpha-beta hydrolase superfamily lysophospholipase
VHPSFSSPARLGGGLLVAATLILAACATDGGSTAPVTTTTGATVAPTAPSASTSTSPAAATTAPGGTTRLAAPEGDAFYVPPDPLPPGEPGDVIWAREIDLVPGAEAWLVLYRSTNVRDEPIAVSAVVAAPVGEVAEARPIAAWAHGTTGLGDQCAPSKALVRGDAPELQLLPVVLDRGWVVVATDYEGLGTPGVHPYAVGLSEGRGVLDAIRAAQRLGGTGADATSPAFVWGHSQGGGAAAFAAELAPTYAPDTNVVGAVAGAPASELKLLGTALLTSPFFGYTFMSAAGFKAAYPDLDLSAVLTDEGLALAEQAAGACSTEIVTAALGQDPTRYISNDPSRVEPFASLLEENTPGQRPTSVPIFLYHGEEDEQIPVELSKLLLDRYCASGVTAYRKTYPGQSHAGVVLPAFPDIERYINDRLAGLPAPSSC